ncbi:hypothetical protein BaRGS_00034110 [Batillaria attramentaria]|uniref:Histone deacetylase interacting domain-containing protein n=1 Tax=Batillaria attramentaria TaxID=370345 RepID=A0ABD0JIZ0_9CAEN
MALGVRNDHSSTVKKPGFPSKAPPGKSSGQLKRPSNSSSGIQAPSSKVRVRKHDSPDEDRRPSEEKGFKYKSGVLKDVSLAEAAKYGSLNEFAYFDKVRRALRHPEVYDNFLRCIVLFNTEVIARSDLITMVHPFLAKFPDLFKWFKDFLGYKESGNTTEALPQGAAKERSIRDEDNVEIDFSTCRKYGASYRALPSTYPLPKCSGRTQLCREVLNDVWVSIPTWSEDSTFVTSKKTQYEEHIYKCEDERFELDYVIETNFSTIKVLEGVQKKLQRMTPEEAAKFRLDNSLGGSSEVLCKKAVCRIYGEKSADILDGLKKNPCVAVPLVLRRLKAKEEEWRDSQKMFNKLWREQNEKYYLKSLDHQGMTFKQNDAKALRSKSIINEIETILEEQNEQQQQGLETAVVEPHIRETYEDKTVFEDAACIIIHHMKRQTSVHTEDKKRIKQLMYHTVRDLFFYPRGELSDDEDEPDSDDLEEKKMKASSGAVTPMETDPPVTVVPKGDKDDTEVKVNGVDAPEKTEGGTDQPANAGNDTDVPEPEIDDTYILFYGNNNWYLFFRLHYKLCSRLLYFRHLSQKMAQDAEIGRLERKHSAAVAIRLKSPFEVEPEQYYQYFLDLIKNLMDCSIEQTQYEDTLREMFGINAYWAFTMDKQIQQLVRVVQHLVVEETSTQLLQLYMEEKTNGATGGSTLTRQQRLAAELNYQRRAEAIMTDENCYKMIIYKNSGETQITLLDQIAEQGEEVAETERWAEYVDRYTSDHVSSEVGSELRHQLLHKPTFMSSNSPGAEESMENSVRSSACDSSSVNMFCSKNKENGAQALAEDALLSLRKRLSSLPQDEITAQLVTNGMETSQAEANTSLTETQSAQAETYTSQVERHTLQDETCASSCVQKVVADLPDPEMVDRVRDDFNHGMSQPGIKTQHTDSDSCHVASSPLNPTTDFIPLESQSSPGSDRSPLAVKEVGPKKRMLHRWCQDLKRKSRDKSKKSSSKSPRGHRRGNVGVMAELTNMALLVWNEKPERVNHVVHESESQQRWQEYSTVEGDRGQQIEKWRASLN